MNETQIATILNDINTNPAFEGIPKSIDGSYAIAEWYNLPADPAYWLWRSNVPTKDAKKAMDWVEYLALSQAARDCWRFMLENGIIDATDPNLRVGIAEVFKGPNGVNSRTALIAIAKRTANRIEKLLATGTGTNASPATPGFEGSVSWNTIWNIWKDS
jgi:hypothetical protein